jgi:hypothetical protein
MKTFAKIQFFFIIPLVCLGFFSCDPNEKLPPETILEFVGIQQFGDETGITDIQIQVHFQSGTGNIGLADGDTLPFFPQYAPPFDKNLFVQVFDKISDTIFVPMQNFLEEDYVLSWRIKTDVANGKQVKGMLNIDVPVEPMNFPEVSKHGIVRFEIYMLDRDLVPSSIQTPDGKIIQGNVVTPEISIR